MARSAEMPRGSGSGRFGVMNSTPQVGARAAGPTGRGRTRPGPQPPGKRPRRQKRPVGSGARKVRRKCARPAGVPTGGGTAPSRRCETDLPLGSRVERRVTVAVEIFDQQMRYVRENGHHVIPLNALANFPREADESPTNLSMRCHCWKNTIILTYFLWLQILLAPPASSHGHSRKDYLSREDREPQQVASSTRQNE
jgi:hypothetical protein